MRDITRETMQQDFQRMLREYADQIKKMSDEYAKRSLHAIEHQDSVKYEGVSEGMLICAEFLASISKWDGPSGERTPEQEPPQDRVRIDDPSLDARRSWAGWLDAGLPWTGELEDAVNRGEVDVS